MASSITTQDKVTWSPWALILPYPLSLQTEQTTQRVFRLRPPPNNREQRSFQKSPTKKMQDKSSPARTLHRRSINSDPQNSLGRLLSCARAYAHTHTHTQSQLLVYLSVFTIFTSFYFFPTLSKDLRYLLATDFMTGSMQVYFLSEPLCME